MSLEDEHSIMPVQTGRVIVPGLKPDTFHPDKGFIAGNFDNLSPEIVKQLNELPWFKSLVDDVRNHKRSAMIVASLGGLTILVAAAGFEFGLRHGRDLESIKGLFPQKKKK